METDIVNTLRQEINKEAYDKNIKIISCLKELKSLTDEENSDEPLEINMENKYMTEINIRNTIEYMEDSLPEKNYYHFICLRLFRLLFLPHENLSYDDLDEKINDYRLVIKLLKNQLDIEEIKEYLDKVINIKNIEGWRKLLRLNFVKITELDIIIAMALKFSRSVVEISDFLILILKKKYVNDFEVKFDLIKLKDIPENNIAQNFYEIFKNSNEYFYLDLEKDKIVKKLLSPEETCIAINKIESEHSESQRKKKKKKHKKKKIQKKDENGKESKLSEDITTKSQKEEDAKNTTASPKEEKLDDKLEKKQNESEEEEEAKENIEKRNQENQSSENSIESEEISQKSKLNKNKCEEIINNIRNELQEQKDKQNQNIESLNSKIEA